MEEWRREAYRLHARSRNYLARLEESRWIIREALKHMNHPYVAFSCGKDSSTLAHLVLEERPDVPLRFLSSGETRIVHNVDEIISWFRARGAIVEEILVDRVWSEEWQDATWDEERKAGRGDLEKLNAGDYDGVFMGLRAQESNRRKMSLYQNQTPGLPAFCYKYKAGRREGMIRCCPLARWQVEDVGAYLLTHGIPVLRQYELHGLEARTTARLTGDAVRQNILSDIKRDNPEGWRKLLKRFPEFSHFV